MKKGIIIVFIVLLCAGATACVSKDNSESQNITMDTTQVQSNSTKVSGYTDIKQEEAKKRLDSETGIILLDVRTQEEYNEIHIPDSLLIPVDVIEEEAPSKLINKEATIFVYCRSGRRSVTASEALVKMGYSNVYNLGGIIDWPYATENSQ